MARGRITFVDITRMFLALLDATNIDFPDSIADIDRIVLSEIVNELNDGLRHLGIVIAIKGVLIVNSAH